MTPAQVDLAVIGAGPAGIEAALEARALGLSVAVLDEQPGPGGQIWRDVLKDRTPLAQKVLGPDYAAGRPLAEAFMAADITRLFRTTVWRLGEDGVSFTGPERSGDLCATRILAATGAMERPMPIPGWTRPGVMTAGAAQILLKTAGTLAEGAVFIGNGPLLLLIACQYLTAGAKIAAVIETAAPGARNAALAHLPGALRQPGMLWKGAKMLAKLARARVPVHRGATDLMLGGQGDTGALSAVTFTTAAGPQRIATDTAFLHQGILPNPNTTQAARAAHRWNDRRLAFEPVLDAFGRTSLPWLMVAGDGAGIAGAEAARLTGRLAAIGAALDLGRLSADKADTRAAPLRAALARATAIRPFLDTLYRPAPETRLPARDDTIVCRCEEVRRGQLMQAVRENCPGPNQFKSFTRAGMGPCQGRICGPTVHGLMADLMGRDPAEVPPYRLRMPIKPVTLGDLAGSDLAGPGLAGKA